MVKEITRSAKTKLKTANRTAGIGVLKKQAKSNKEIAKSAKTKVKTATRNTSIGGGHGVLKKYEESNKEITKSTKTKLKTASRDADSGDRNGVWEKQAKINEEITKSAKRKPITASRIAGIDGGNDVFKKIAKSNQEIDKSAKTKLKTASKTAGIGGVHRGNGALKKQARSRLDLSKKSNKLEQSNSSNLGYLKTTKKFGEKKKVEDESEPLDAHSKRKKRVIRIDPYDISNKRLDDGIALNDITNQKKDKKKEDPEKVEPSRNAQFRAIKPSPSILNFVEENLLGRRRDIELRKAGYNVELSAPLDNIPFSTSSERERIEESIFRNKLTFFAAAKVSSSFPPPDLPEIAFAGRSNVGKSSLLNALTRQWGVVRTSDKPGLTRTINFFKLGSKLCLVDLPGYGFAYAKEEVKEAWEELVKEYVSTRVGLKRVCLLVDTKWGMKARDFELIHLMERSETRYQIVLTKTDAVFPVDVARRAMQIEESLKDNKSVVQPLMMVSSKSGAGIRSLRTVLAKIARFVKP